MRNPEAIRLMFDRISRRYDLANHVLSGGCDFLWRKRASEIVSGWKPPCVLDVATGSGDLALALARELPGSQISSVDFSPKMVAIAKAKGLRDVITGDALHLPFASQSFDAVTVAFGLRNMQDWAAALKEMRRVLTCSGHLLLLDFSLPEISVLRALYRFYLHRVVPGLCRLVTGEKSAYSYLGASIELFPSGIEMCRLIEGNGFAGATGIPLTGGIVSVYTATASKEMS